MQISISVRHGHLSEKSQDKIRGKVDKLNRLFDRLSAISVTVNVEDESNPQVDLQVSAEHKHDFTASDRASSVMAALDSCLHKMEQQIRKYKEKIQDHHR